MNSSWLWTAAAFVGAYVAYEMMKPAPGVHEIGESDIVFNPEADSEDIDRQTDGQPRAGEHPPANEQLRAGEQPQAGERPQEGDQNGGDVGAQWDQDDRARRALEARQAEQADAPRMNAWKQKGVVGTKKAKSLARRDQRRAYFEYVRQEAERERERIQLEEQMFGDLIAEEREERRARINEAKLALDEANRARRAREEEERQARQARRVEIEQQLRQKGLAKLSSDADIEIAEDISCAVVLESGDYAVSVTDTVIDGLSDALKEQGRIPLSEIQQMLPKYVS